MTSIGRVTLRPATKVDEALLLAWANDPVTRAAGFRPEPIPADQHAAWFADRLLSTTSRLLIGVADDVPVGQIRLDRLDSGRVEIGIAVAPEMRGRGIGRILLRLGKDEARRDPALGSTSLVARIRPENAASIALFTGAGFRLAGETRIRGYRCLIYEANA